MRARLMFGSRRAREILLLSCAALSLVLACVSGSRYTGPVNKWWDERGPVVPHDSFPADCTLCHVGETWHVIRDDFEYDHEAQTGHALEGAHASAECLRCHNDRGPVQIYAARGCAGCHEDVHRGELGANCVDCHGESDWRPSGIIAMHRQTRMPLVGAHAAAACWRCHPGAQVGEFGHTDTECVTCHKDDLDEADDPDHAAMGWVSSCDRCHIPTTWTGGGFNHGTWPLTGAHRSIDCEACHEGGVFGGTPRACSACHLDDYNGTTDPDHVALNFPMQCEQCHGTGGWTPANFDHSGISDRCVTCHADDYANTDDPDHRTAGFPTSCENCHSTQRWTPANWNHSFPINNGRHSGFDCIDCHTTGSFPEFSCIDCHEHRQSESDDEHEDVRGYVYSSPACLMCHPDGDD